MEKPSHKLIIGVLTSVIAGLILRYTTGTTLLDIIAWTWSFTKACWHVLFMKAAVSYWLLGVLILLSSATLIWVIHNITATGKELSDLAYLVDRFEGLVWRWQFGTRGTILNTWCFCPTCDTVLVYREDTEMRYGNGGGFHDVTHFTCEHCRSDVGKLEGRRATIVPRIERQIDRKLRTGEWRAVVEQEHARKAARA